MSHDYSSLVPQKANIQYNAVNLQNRNNRAVLNSADCNLNKGKVANILKELQLNGQNENYQQPLHCSDTPNNYLRKAKGKDLLLPVLSSHHHNP